ncbi:unnamed protein product [Eruca vesicaria subsp. sativa]|uniref:Uncharacterized protein n=1 Tax=Eruca vesicaria subsp. sativa TaxID=29727 RepID=A0ABC8JT15_ERUVS|nr:unnamed protein product [Eruca vesicaria subsp. sativa]
MYLSHILDNCMTILIGLIVKLFYMVGRENLESSAELDISLLIGSEVFDDEKRSNIHNFLLWIMMVADMKLCANTFKVKM